MITDENSLDLTGWYVKHHFQASLGLVPLGRA